MKTKNRSRWGLSRLIILSGVPLMVAFGVSSAEAGELGRDSQRANFPAELKDARIGEDPDIIPQNRSIVGRSPVGGSVHIWNPMVACTVREIGNDPDPVPTVW